ncbi:MAG: hypothetical protein RJB38_776 [Pseudomonadota bacterium]|jgi:UDP-2,3-diacylglucosamine hydrolase
MSASSPPTHVHILSDLHLLHPEEAFYQNVLRFMQEVPNTGDHFILAGDIFDVFVGNKAAFTRLHRPFFEQARRCEERGVHLHHIEGNHDFWLAGAYRQMRCEKIQIHGDFCSISVDGHTLRVEHGDLADPNDQNYLRLRSFFRSPLGATLIQCAPGALLERLGHFWSDSSRKRQSLPEDWMPEKRAELRSIFFAYAKSLLENGSCSALVMGHCHDPHEIPGYMNVGFPRKHGHWIRWSPSSNTLERLPLQFGEHAPAAKKPLNASD